MILVSENSRADNGMQVQSTVRLNIEEVGKVERPFFVNVSVDHSSLFHTYCLTEADAETIRARMHATYLEVHANTAE